MDLDWFCGEIRPFAFAAAPSLPDGVWLRCFGSFVSVNQFQMLSAVIGHTYGGTPGIYIGLPNLQGRTPLGAGVLAASEIPTADDPIVEGDTATSSIRAGVSTGAPTATIDNFGLPAHRHVVGVRIAPAPYKGATAIPGPNVALSRPVFVNSSANLYSIAPAFSSVPATPILNTQSIGSVGGSDGPNAAPHENRQPFLAMNFWIASYGLWPGPYDTRPDQLKTAS